MTNFDSYANPIIHFGNAHEQMPKPSPLVVPNQQNRSE